MLVTNFAFLSIYLQEASKLNSMLCQTFVFCYLWALGGNLIDSHWDTFDTFVRQQFEGNSDAKVLFYTKIHLKYTIDNFDLTVKCLHLWINVSINIMGTFCFIAIINDNHISLLIAFCSGKDTIMC